MAPDADPSGPLSQRAIAQYRAEHVTHLGQKELLLMLYDGALRFCDEGRAALAARDVNAGYHKLVRARDIVTELLAILDPDVEADVVSNLRRLYDFCIYGITEVNFTKDLDLLDAVMRVLRNLRRAWAELDFDAALDELMEEAGVAAPARSGPPPTPQPATDGDPAGSSGGFTWTG